MLQDIIAVDYRGIRIKRIVRRPAPVVAFIPVGIFGKPLFVPTDRISCNKGEFNVFAETSFGMDAVNDNRLTIPLFFIFSDGYRNFYELPVVLCEVSIKASSSERCGFQFIVVKFNLFLYVFRNRFYLFDFHFISPQLCCRTGRKLLSVWFDLQTVRVRQCLAVRIYHRQIHAFLLRIIFRPYLHL